MQKIMIAKYRGKCAVSGATINPGDDITYCTVTKKAWLTEPGDCLVDSEGDYLATSTPKNYPCHFKITAISLDY